MKNIILSLLFIALCTSGSIAQYSISPRVGEVMDAGPHSVVFNGENLPLGMYKVKITSGASSEEMKVVLSK